LSRREKLFWLIVAALFLVGVLSLIPNFYEICELSEKTKEEHCATHQVVPFLFIKVLQLLDRMGGAHYRACDYRDRYFYPYSQESYR
jgi:hypothetical protein